MSAALSFITPPPGLAPLTKFTLSPIDGADGLYSLQATESEPTRLFVLDAAVHLPDYSPIISDEQSGALALAVSTDALLLVVVTPGAGGATGGSTVNLMAPIVVNAASGVCAQVILDGQDWPLQAPLGARAA